MKKFFLALALVGMGALLMAGCIPQETNVPTEEPAADVEVVEPAVTEEAAPEATEAPAEQPAAETPPEEAPAA